MSDIIDRYLNQSMVWKKRLAIDKYNEPTTHPTTIKGRLESGHRLLRNDKGEEVVATSFFITKSAVAVNDYLDDMLILGVQPIYSLGGTITWYEVYLGNVENRS